MDSIGQEILAAHGGAALWGQLQGLDVELSASGFLFTAKRIAPRPALRVSVQVQPMEVILHDYPQPGHRGILFADSTVRWWDPRGEVVAERRQPRTEFHRLRRQLYWDELDFAYFCGYALWNYLCMPWLLSRPHLATLQPVSSSPAGGQCLRVVFDPAVVTHCQTQVFHFNDRWQLCRHDYTAEVVGAWAKAAHLSSDYRDFDGLALPVKRRVYPTLMGSGPLPWPTLVALDIRAVRQRRFT